MKQTLTGSNDSSFLWIWLWLCGSVMLFSVSSALADPKSLRETLGAERFEAFGLSRLTVEELARLEAWLAAGQPAVAPSRAEMASADPPSEPAKTVASETSSPSSATAAEVATAVAEFGEEQVARGRRNENSGDRIEARIQGAFDGWDGNTLFRLVNGQVWQQRISGRYRYRAESPEVEIVKGRFGYYLEVIETGRQVGVRRVR